MIESKINKQTTILLVLSLVNISLVITAFFVIFQKQAAYNKTLSEYQIAQNNSLTQQQLNQYFNSHQATTNRLSTVFPNQNNIVSFLTIINEKTRLYDPSASVKFAALTPSKILNQLQIPLIIKLQTTPANILTYFRDLERLPYIIEITSLEIKTPQGIGGISDITIGARIYVQDPFNP